MFKKGHKARYIRVVLKARAWKRLPMKLLNWGKKMTSTKQYNLVPNDEYDTKIPLYSDEAFQYGITFQAKYIGSLDVPRPSNRVEIVAAMRRVRYEFKTNGMKKHKVTIHISTDGVRVTSKKIITLKKKGPASKLFGRGSKTNTFIETTELMNHPIYRIFYVSHDSSDLKIFSYIAREGSTNVFKCNVFKSNQKSQAMRIVRTVGQAFEVCHKMQTSDQPAPSTSSAVYKPAPSDCGSDAHTSKGAATDCGASETGGPSTTKALIEEGAVGGKVVPARPNHLELLPPPPKKEGKKTSQRTTPAPTINLLDLPECVTKEEAALSSDAVDDPTTPLSAQHQLQLLRERLEQEAQETRAAVAQLLLLRDQLAVEQAARCEAQARTHELLVHNKELLEHIAALVAHLQDRERGTSRPISAQQLTLLPQNAAGGAKAAIKSDNTYNDNEQQLINDAFIDLFYPKANSNYTIENNNLRFSSPIEPINVPSSAPSFGGMTNEQIQNYLISKFQDMGGFPNEQKTNNFDGNQQYYQNCKAFPNIPPLSNHFSSSDLASLLNHTAYKDTSSSTDELDPLAHMSVGISENSLCSNDSETSTSKDSSPEESISDEGLPFIMPLSHNGTLAATGNDGRVRLIVPVSPSESASDVVEIQPEVQSSSGHSLQVPGQERLLAPAAPITRTTSEKVPNRSEMMTALRSQWTRHTTK